MISKVLPLISAVDGSRVAQELSYRSTRIESGSFDDAVAAVRRRSPIRLVRGCHTLQVTLRRSTVDVVGLRVLHDERSPTKRAWEDRPVLGGAPAIVVVGETETAYRRVDAGKSARLSLAGPAWVRVLSRPLGASATSSGAQSYGLAVLKDERPFRSYRLAAKRSERKSRTLFFSSPPLSAEASSSRPPL